MAGHSKWTQIKRQKSVTDAAKSRAFSRFARLIAFQSKKAAGNVSAPGLAAALLRAKAANMPKENIERAIAKGSSKESGDLAQVVYEAYGPSGVAILISALTDNKNRTTREIKHMLSTLGVALASPGAATWAFSRTPDGVYMPNPPGVKVVGTDEERLSAVLTALDEHDDVERVFTNAHGYEHTD